MQPAGHGTAISGSAAACAITIIIWLLSLFHVEMPAEVQAAFTGLITAAFGYYLTRNGAVSGSFNTAGATVAPPNAMGQ